MVDKRTLIEAARYLEFVVLDDLGTEGTSDWAIDVVASLVRDRTDHRLAMVITSHLTPTEVEERYGESLASRMWAAMPYIHVTGPDQAPRP